LTRQLRRAGVAVDLVEIEGDIHVWGGPELERAVERALQFFDHHLLGPTGEPRTAGRSRPPVLARPAGPLALTAVWR
jgi:hypothetical protein